MPKIMIKDECEFEEASYILFESLIHNRSLIYASLPFFMKSMLSY